MELFVIILNGFQRLCNNGNFQTKNLAVILITPEANLGPCQKSESIFAKKVNPLQPSVAYLYPLKTSENVLVF